MISYEQFSTQENVDRYFEDTQRLASGLDSQDTAIALLKRIKYLEAVSDEYYVPNDIEEWSKKAMDYIDSPDTYFRRVLYEIIERQHQNFFESVEILETCVMNGELSEDELFSTVMSFNSTLDETNMSCEKYGTQKFSEYRFKSPSLQRDYDEWLKDCVGM